jgi:hypothetical protein
MGQRVCAAALARARVIGREDAADERNDGQRMSSVVADGVDIPPRVAASRYRLAEARSASTAAAAKRPESAAIGTPGPGWVLPPAR